jgi:hypothetical protein
MMGEKIELDFEQAAAVWYCGCRKPACADIQRNLPLVIHMWAEREADLAGNLCPHVERRSCFIPACKRQRRPDRYVFCF